MPPKKTRAKSASVEDDDSSSQGTRSHPTTPRRSSLRDSSKTPGSTAQKTVSFTSQFQQDDDQDDRPLAQRRGRRTSPPQASASTSAEGTLTTISKGRKASTPNTRSTRATSTTSTVDIEVSRLNLNDREPASYNLSAVSRIPLPGTGAQSLAHTLGRIIDPNTDMGTATSLVHSIADAWNKNQGIAHQLSEVIQQTLDHNTRYQELCRADKEMNKAMAKILKQGRDASSSRRRMSRNLEFIRQYVGDDFFQGFLFDEMTPNVAAGMWRLCQWAYNNDINFYELYRLVNRIRESRIMAGASQGVSPTSSLTHVDITRAMTAIEDGFQAKQITRGNGEREFDRDLRDLVPRTWARNDVQHRAATLRRNGHLPICFDDDGFIHTGDTVPEILRIRGIGGYPVPAETPRTYTNGRLRPRQPNSKLLLVSGNSQKDQPSNTQKDQPSNKRGRTSDINDTPDLKVDIDTANNGAGKTDADAQPSPPKKTKTSKSKKGKSKDDPIDINDRALLRGLGLDKASLTRHWGYATGLADYKLGAGRSDHGDIEGLVQPVSFLSSQFGLRGPGQRVPKLKLSDQLPSQLFNTPSTAESKLLEFLHTVHRNFEDPRIPTANWLASMEDGTNDLSENEIRDAITHVDSAITPLLNHNGINTIMNDTRMPWHSIFGIYNFLYGISAANQLRLPAWGEMIRSQINEVVEYYGSDFRATVNIGVDSVGREIRLHPSSMTMDNLYVSRTHQGWLGTSLLLPVLQYLTQTNLDVQVIDPDEYADYRRGRLNDFTYADPTQRSIMMVPINTGNHWTLLVLNFQTRTYEWLNSMRGGIPRGTVSHILDHVMGVRNASNDWRQGTLQSQQQANGADCGIWVIANAVAYTNTRAAAGPQSTGQMRLWLTNILTDVLLGLESPIGTRQRASAPWVTRDLGSSFMKAQTVDATTQTDPTQHPHDDVASQQAAGSIADDDDFTSHRADGDTRMLDIEDAESGTVEDPWLQTPYSDLFPGDDNDDDDESEPPLSPFTIPRQTQIDTDMGSADTAHSGSGSGRGLRLSANREARRLSASQAREDHEAAVEDPFITEHPERATQAAGRRVSDAGSPSAKPTAAANQKLSLRVTKPVTKKGGSKDGKRGGKKGGQK